MALHLKWYGGQSDFDYFRGRPFSTAVPAIYDDGDIGDEPTKKKIPFAIQTFRFFIIKLRGDVSHVDGMAILKRSVFLIFSRNIIYWRLPTALEVNVPCMSWCRPHLLKDSCKHILSNYKKNGPPPADQLSRQVWEDARLLEAIRQHDNPTTAPTVSLPGPVRVKQERFVWARALSSATLRTPIDLDSPSPPPKKARVDELSEPLHVQTMNPDFAGFQSAADEDEDVSDPIPSVGDMSLSQELEQIIDQTFPDEMDIASPGPEERES